MSPILSLRSAVESHLHHDGRGALRRLSARPSVPGSQRSRWPALLLAACCVAFATHSSACSETSRPADAKPPIFADLSLADAIARNGDDGRILVVKATAVWCGPCKRMDATTWREDAVVEWFGKQGVALSLDVDQHPADAQRLRVRGMPTLIAFKGGKEVDRVVGYQAGSDLIAWLERVSQGETTQSRLDALLARPREGEGALAIQERLRLAGDLLMAERLDEATEEYVWLWENMVRVQPSMAGVRGSFTAGEIARLVAEHDGARERFTALRDAAGERMKEDPGAHRWLDDWIVLNEVLGDEAATLEWWDRIKDSPGNEQIVSRVDFRLVDLLERNDRWADMGRLVRQPMRELANDVQLFEMILSRETPRDTRPDAGGGARVDTATMMRDLAVERLRTSASRLYASLLAADRESEAAEIAAEAIRVEPVDPELMAQALVATALRADQPRAEQRALLEPRPLPQPKNPSAASGTGPADENARVNRRTEALHRLDAALTTAPESK